MVVGARELGESGVRLKNTGSELPEAAEHPQEPWTTSRVERQTSSALTMATNL